MAGRLDLEFDGHDFYFILEDAQVFHELALGNGERGVRRGDLGGGVHGGRLLLAVAVDDRDALQGKGRRTGHALVELLVGQGLHVEARGLGEVELEVAVEGILVGDGLRPFPARDRLALLLSVLVDVAHLDLVEEQKEVAAGRRGRERIDGLGDIEAVVHLVTHNLALGRRIVVVVIAAASGQHSCCHQQRYGRCRHRQKLFHFDLIFKLIFCLFNNYLYLCTRKTIKLVTIMTAMQMNAELFRQLSIIAEDESLMAKAVKYLKKLTAKKEAIDETEYLMSSPAMAEIIRQGQEDIKNGRGEVVKIEDLWK